jgi:hypothetical protein
MLFSSVARVGVDGGVGTLHWYMQHTFVELLSNSNAETCYSTHLANVRHGLAHAINTIQNVQNDMVSYFLCIFSNFTATILHFD